MYALNQAHNTHTVHAAYSPPVAAAATLPLVSEEVASAPAPSDMAQRMMFVVAVCRRCVISPRFLGVLWYCCTVFRRTDVPIGRRTAFWSCRCVFTYHVVCSSTSFTVPSWYRPIGEIAPGCLLSAAALPGKAVCSIYQFSIAPIGEMAPGVPCKALNKII